MRSPRSRARSSSSTATCRARGRAFSGRSCSRRLRAWPTRSTACSPARCCSTCSSSAPWPWSPPTGSRRGSAGGCSALRPSFSGSLAPWLLLLFALDPYDPVVRDRVLPLVLGLTAEPAFPAAVALVALRRADLDLARPPVARWGRARGAGRGCRSRGGAAQPALPRRAPRARTSPPAASPRQARSRSRSLPAVLAVVLWQARALDGPDPLVLRPGGLGPVHDQHGGAARVLLEPTSPAVAAARGSDRRRRRSVPLALLLGGWVLSVRRRPRLAARRSAATAERSSACCCPPCRPTSCSWPRSRCSSRHSPSGWARGSIRCHPAARPGRGALAIAAVVLALVPLATAALGS